MQMRRTELNLKTIQDPLSSYCGIIAYLLARNGTQDLEKRNPKIAKLLSELPSNELLAMEVMKSFPVVIGHSGLDIEGDAKRDDINESSVKVFVGKGKNPKEWLISYPGLLANVGEFEKAASGSGTVSVAQEPDGIIRRVPLISNVAGEIRPTLGLDMIRVAFQGNSIATRTCLLYTSDAADE